MSAVIINVSVENLVTVSEEVSERDPRRMTTAELNQQGHFQQPLLEIMRAKCLDCCGGQSGEVRRCPASDCVNWPYRMGTNPFARRSLSDAERQARRERMLNARACRTLDKIEAAAEIAV
jgi:hypothetical protein